MTIFQLMENYVSGKEMPKRIKYSMMMDGYEHFRWDNENSEYVCEADNTCFLNVPWHHLLDVVEIIEQTEKGELQIYITEDRDTQVLDAWQAHHRNATSAVDNEQTERSE